ncbi:ligase-associated DNA damage response endonuclease PdeM [Novosphingobium sp. TH158]|uniref:ligase-associated DNA damage response endonuclease PdeM n=1 Tax=Novosphingobium sp. TH158 TaxID=2067455 RepID=UPI000C7B5A88|nr:ligase-associated DNA damage response endonuclease PdeM [Novosphingobium sp. TH158]PLK26852.1 phosphoesterase [Novosphingobium sp. TH158]
MVPFSFAGEEWRFLRSGALFWPRENALLVADLHLEKGSFFARFGQMIPPYDSRETLERLAIAIRESGARRVICLGDSFHDARGADRLEPYAAGMLSALTRVADWLWITGNHDEGLSPRHGGTLAQEAVIGGVILRHQARRGECGAELSGHFHPRLRLSVRGRNIVRACAVASENRLVLPAFGAFTGGMDAADPEILAALQPARTIRALLATQGKVAEFPLWAAA